MPVLNGEKFLSEQLESIFIQQDCHFEIHIADNGSYDGTIKIIYEYLNLGLVSSVIHVAKKGSTHTFFQLIESVDSDAYVAFADQDDIWDSKKLSVLLNSMRKSHQPQLIFSDREFIDENGNLIKQKTRKNPNLSWQNAVIQNIVPGNTMLLNPAAINFIKSLGEVPVKHYDAWIYLLVSLFGNVSYVPDVLVSYRLHSENTVGIRKSWTPWVWIKSLRDYLNQVKLLGDLMTSKRLDIPSKDFLKLVVLLSHRNPLKRISIIFRCHLYRQSKLETFLFKLGMIPFLIVGRKFF